MSKVLSQDELNTLHKYFEEMLLDSEEIEARKKFAEKIYESFYALFETIKESDTDYGDESEEWWLFFIDEATDFYLDVLEEEGLTDDFYTDRAKDAATEVVDTIKKTTEEKGSPDSVLTAEKLMVIAWTETNIIKNHELNIRKKEEGFTTKTWVTMGDEKVRLEHYFLDGTTVGIEEDFDVEGYPMAYPCDTSRKPPANLVVNCRCGLRYE